jgi:hypothetical protein
MPKSNSKITSLSDNNKYLQRLKWESVEYSTKQLGKQILFKAPNSNIKSNSHITRLSDSKYVQFLKFSESIEYSTGQCGQVIICKKPL